MSQCARCSGRNGNHFSWCLVRGGSGRLLATPRRTRYWLTVAEVAAELRCKESTVVTLIRRGRLTVIKRANRRLISMESVNKVGIEWNTVGAE